MTSVGRSEGLRGTAMTIAMLAAGAVGLSGVANAAPQGFDIQGYSTCTATTAPGPGEDFDGMVTSCCVQNAGVPTPSRYGMACVAPAPEVLPADYRPTIVLPMRPQPTDDAGLLLGDLDPNDNPDLPIDSTPAENPFDGPQ